MAIPKITGQGYSRSVAVNVKNRLDVHPPAIFIDRVNVLEGEQITVKWKRSPYFPSVVIYVSEDPAFLNTVKRIEATNPEGSVIGTFPPGTYYVRASWDTKTVILPKG